MSDISNQLLTNFTASTRSYPPDGGWRQYWVLGISSPLLVSQSLHEVIAGELPPETAWSILRLGCLVSSSPPSLCMAVKTDKSNGLTQASFSFKDSETDNT